jgi:hypothetical protein
VEDDIKEWLNKSGYPLELFVASELKRREYICGKSELFVDIETGKNREIDITGYHHGSLDSDDYHCSRYLVFECKKSEKPLLNLCVNDEMKSRFYLHAYHGDPEDVMKPDVMAFINYEKNKEHEILIGEFSKKTTIGYSLVPAFGKSDQDIYSGLMGLIKASTYYRRLYADYANEARLDLSSCLQDRNAFQFHLAALIVDAPLFDVFIKPDGSLNISPSDWSMMKIQLPWNFVPHDNGQGYCIHIVTKNAFCTFLDSVEKLNNYIYLPQHVEFLLDRRPMREPNLLNIQISSLKRKWKLLSAIGKSV